MIDGLTFQILRLSPLPFGFTSVGNLSFKKEMYVKYHWKSDGWYDCGLTFLLLMVRLSNQPVSVVI